MATLLMRKVKGNNNKSAINLKTNKISAGNEKARKIKCLNLNGIKIKFIKRFFFFFLIPLN